METVSVEGLTVHFVGGPASDEVVLAAERCFGRTTLPKPLTLVARWGQPGVLHDLRLVAEGMGEFRAKGPRLLPALHKLCDHATSLHSASDLHRQRWIAARASRMESGLFAAVTLESPR